VAVLIANGADPTVKCDLGRDLLFMAVCSCHMFLVNHFHTKHGLALTSTDSSGFTPLMAAANCGHTSVAEWLLQQKAAVNTLNDHCDSALHLAVRNGHTAVVTSLLTHGADVAHTNTFDMTCLHRAVHSSHAEMVQLLLSGGAVTVINALGVETDDADCMTALMMCTNTAIAQLLLDAGADVHETTGTGDTCLHVAAAHKHPVSVLCLLIKAGADIHAVNDDGQTAAEVAHEYGNELAEQLLIRAARV
jgi:uncharacterized protein